MEILFMKLGLATQALLTNEIDFNFGNWITSDGVTVLYSIVAGIMLVLVTAFAKSIIKIFKLGVAFKHEFVSKEEFIQFKLEIKKDMQSWKSELETRILETCMRTINREVRDIDDFKDTARQIESDKKVMENQIKNMTDKYDEVKSIGDNVRVLNTKITRLEYGEKNSDKRRTE